MVGVHFGVSRVFPLLRERYYFPDMERYVREYIGTCHRCQVAKATRNLKHGLLQPKMIGEVGTVSLDYQGPYPISHGKEMLLIIKDCFSNEVRLIAMGNTDATHTIDVFWREWINGGKGLPRRILTDRGPQFENKLVARLCERLGIDASKTAVYHPQTNTNSERQNAFHLPLLKALDDDPKNWVKRLPYLQFAMNTSPIDGLGISPYEIETGRAPILPWDLYALPPDDFSFQVDLHQHKLSHPREMHRAHALIKRLKVQQWARMKQYYDSDKKEVSYVSNDLVRVSPARHVHSVF